MKKRSVKYSIVIPTRNRAHLLRHSLKCALNQTFDDYEIVVCDNNSSDSTSQDMEGCRDKTRVRYFRTSKTLPMPDNWEFALKKTEGEWITFLTDDSAISSRLLSQADKILSRADTEVLSWSHLSRYFHANWPHESEKNTLTYHAFSGKSPVIKSETLLHKWYHFIPDHTAPVSLNSFCRRKLIERIQARANRFFFHPCPDISSSVAMMAHTNHYVYLDLPLAINGIGQESIGMSQATARGKAALEFQNEFRDGPMFSEVPLDLPVVANYIVESLLRTKKAFPDRLKFYDIDRGLYFSHCLSSLCFLANRGADVEKEKQELFRVLSAQPFSVRARAHLDILRRKFNPSRAKDKVRQMLRGSMNSIKPLILLESLFRRPPEYGKTVSGTSGGFTNIFEAMAYLDQRVFSKDY